MRSLSRRLNKVIEVYKSETGIDIRKSIQEGKFSNRSMQPDDKTQFIQWLFHRVGYDAKPKRVTEFSAHKWFNKISLDPKNPNYLNEPTTFYRGIRPTKDKSTGKIKQELVDGKYHPSGTFTSDWGRGIYITKYRPTADRYTREIGEVLELGGIRI